jgi:hypothetical protein
MRIWVSLTLGLLSLSASSYAEVKSIEVNAGGVL